MELFQPSSPQTVSYATVLESLATLPSLLVLQWRSYIGAFRAHALPNSLSALPLSVIILVESGKRLIVLSEQFSL